MLAMDLDDFSSDEEDSHKCGNCRESYHKLSDWFTHKRSRICKPLSTRSAADDTLTARAAAAQFYLPEKRVLKEPGGGRIKVEQGGDDEGIDRSEAFGEYLEHSFRAVMRGREETGGQLTSGDGADNMSRQSAGIGGAVDTLASQSSSFIRKKNLFSIMKPSMRKKGHPRKNPPSHIAPTATLAEGSPKGDPTEHADFAREEEDDYRPDAPDTMYTTREKERAMMAVSDDEIDESYKRDEPSGNRSRDPLPPPPALRPTSRGNESERHTSRPLSLPPPARPRHLPPSSGLVAPPPYPHHLHLPHHFQHPYLPHSIMGQGMMDPGMQMVAENLSMNADKRKRGRPKKSEVIESLHNHLRQFSPGGSTEATQPRGRTGVAGVNGGKEAHEGSEPARRDVEKFRPSHAVLPKVYKCERCSKAFIKLSHLQRHMNKKNPCEMRQQVFTEETDNQSIFEGGIIMFKCGACPYSVTNHSDILSHHSREHPAFYPGYCKFCGKYNERKNKLLIHLSQHTDQSVISEVALEMKRIKLLKVDKVTASSPAPGGQGVEAASRMMREAVATVGRSNSPHSVTGSLAVDMTPPPPQPPLTVANLSVTPLPPPLSVSHLADPGGSYFPSYAAVAMAAAAMQQHVPAPMLVQCQVCQMTFMDEQDLVSHHNGVHAPVGGTVSRDELFARMGLSAGSAEALWGSLMMGGARREHPLICCYCLLGYEDEEALESHMNLHRVWVGVGAKTEAGLDDSFDATGSDCGAMDLSMTNKSLSKDSSNHSKSPPSTMTRDKEESCDNSKHEDNKSDAENAAETECDHVSNEIAEESSLRKLQPPDNETESTTEIKSPETSKRANKEDTSNPGSVETASATYQESKKKYKKETKKESNIVPKRIEGERRSTRSQARVSASSRTSSESAEKRDSNSSTSIKSEECSEEDGCKVGSPDETQSVDSEISGEVGAEARDGPDTIPAVVEDAPTRTQGEDKIKEEDACGGTQDCKKSPNRGVSESTGSIDGESSNFGKDSDNSVEEPPFSTTVPTEYACWLCPDMPPRCYTSRDHWSTHLQCKHTLTVAFTCSSHVNCSFRSNNWRDVVSHASVHCQRSFVCRVCNSHHGSLPELMSHHMDVHQSRAYEFQKEATASAEKRNRRRGSSLQRKRQSAKSAEKKGGGRLDTEKPSAAKRKRQEDTDCSTPSPDEDDGADTHRPDYNSLTIDLEQLLDGAASSKYGGDDGNIPVGYSGNSESRPFACDMCESSFPFRERLNQHIKNVHGPRKFICDSCGAGFKRSDKLKRHMSLHSEERPYVCFYPGCSRSFKRTDGLRAHHRYHDDEDKIWPCPLGCKVVLPTHDTFEEHMKQAHDIQNEAGGVRTATGSRPTAQRTKESPDKRSPEPRSHLLTPHRHMAEQLMSTSQMGGIFPGPPVPELEAGESGSEEMESGVGLRAEALLHLQLITQYPHPGMLS